MRSLCVLFIAALIGGTAVNTHARLVARIDKTNAGPVLTINGVPAAPTIFFVNLDTDEKLRPLQLSEITTAGKYGVSIVSFPIGMPWPKNDQTRDFSHIDARIEAVLKANPSMLIIPRIGVTWPPQWWIEEHLDEMMLYDDGQRQTASVHSHVWRQTAFENLKALVAHLEAKFGEHVLGYHPCGQHTGEWFYDRSWDRSLSGLEPPTRLAFKNYVRAKYRTDSALRAAWGDPDARLDDVDIPSIRDQKRSLAAAFRDPLAERKVIDFFEFSNKEMADVVELMCRAVKEAAPDKLSVTFYGYHFEVSALPFGLQTSGHLCLGRLLRSPWIDVFCSPVSYTDRGPGGGGYFMAPVDSVQLHGKLWLIEDDTRTHLGEPDPQYALQKTKNARETEGVLGRNFAHILTRSAAIWWMDLFGIGWFQGDEMWQYLGKLSSLYQKALSRSRPYQPQIAVIVDERSALYTQPAPVPLVQLLNSFRLQLYRIGAPIGFYLLDDLISGTIPPARMYIILNAFELDDAQLAAIRQHVCKRGSTVVWMYAPSVISGNRLLQKRIREITGIAVSETKSSSSIVIEASGERFDAGHSDLQPSFAIDDPTATVVARWEDSRQPAVAYKTIKGCTSVYSAALQLPASVLRELARQAGVHIYTDQGDIVMAGNSFLAIHASTGGTKKLVLPAEYSVVDCLTGEGFGRARSITFDMKQGDTKLLKIDK